MSSNFVLKDKSTIITHIRKNDTINYISRFILKN